MRRGGGANGLDLDTGGTTIGAGAVEAGASLLWLLLRMLHGRVFPGGGTRGGGGGCSVAAAAAALELSEELDVLLRGGGGGLNSEWGASSLDRLGWGRPGAPLGVGGVPLPPLLKAAAIRPTALEISGLDA